MAIRIYRKEWIISIVLLVATALMFFIPLLFFSVAHLFEGIHGVVFVLMFLCMLAGIAFFSVAVLYLIAIIIYVQFDKRKMQKYPNEENIKPGLKPYQRSLIWTISLFLLTLTIFSTYDFYTHILIGISAIFMLITLILYAVHFKRKRNTEKEVNNGK